MSATIRQVVDDAQKIVGEVAGSGVQVFSEDRMKDDVVRGFNLLFKKRFWEQYTQWFTVVLNGTTGKTVEEAFEQVIDFEDFQQVRAGTGHARLPVLNSNTMPLGLTGTRLLCWTSLLATDADYDKRKLQFYPLTAVGTLYIRARVYPLEPPTVEFDWEDKFYLDRDMLAYGAAYMTLAGDDLNPAAAEVCRGLMEGRFKDIVAALPSSDVTVQSSANIPNDWRVAQ